MLAMLRAAFVAALASIVTSSIAPQDGLSQLPAVASMMNVSKSTVGRISSRVSKLSAHIGDVMKAQQKELAQQKAEYEEQLKAEVSANAKIETQIGEESTDIWELEKANNQLRARAHQLQKDNSQLRHALEVVLTKVAAADNFTTATLSLTDDTESADLDVIRARKAATKSEATADDQELDQEGDDTQSQDDEAQEQDDAEAEADALIALSTRRFRRQTSRVRRSDDEQDDENDDSDEDVANETSTDASMPEEDVGFSRHNATDPRSHLMVKELSQEIQKLQEQQDQSRADLVKMFQARFNKGKKEKAQMLAKLDALNSTKSSLQGLRTKLQGAVTHLEHTKGKLEGRLQGLGKYLAQLAKYVREPAAAAEKDIPLLPNDVAVFLQRQAKKA